MSFYQGRAYSILHPTDFSKTSEIAFAHALAIAVKNKADLTILHVEADKNKDIDWHEFPAIRETLERWGEMEPGSRRSDISAKLGIQVDKRVAIDANPVKAVVELSNVDSFDLLVMGTSGNNNYLIEPPSSLKISQQTRLPTLFIIEGGRSCVDLTTGKPSLRKVILAVDHQPSARPGLARICTMVHSLAIAHPEVHLLYVGSESQFPDIEVPATDEITWSKVCRSGTPSTEITNYAKEENADLIVMVTSGRRSLWDMLTGSTVQNVLKNAPCPVFTLPVE